MSEGKNKFCPSCGQGEESFVMTEVVINTGVKKMKVSCECGRFIKWGSPYSPEERERRRLARASMRSRLNFEERMKSKGKVAGPCKSKYKDVFADIVRVK